MAYSGSEPIRQDSLASFADTFKACGFDPQSFSPATAWPKQPCSSRQPPWPGYPALALDADALAANRAEPGTGSVLMSCGFPQPGHAVRIVEPQQLQRLGDNQVGEIWAGGPSIASGYWRNPEASARTFVEMDGRPGCEPATWVSCVKARCSSPGA